MMCEYDRGFIEDPCRGCGKTLITIELEKQNAALLERLAKNEIMRPIQISVDNADELLKQQLAAANARIAELESNKCETCFSNYAKATGKLADRAEAAESECRRLRVCGNCRHYSQGYSVDCCVKNCGHGEDETWRSNTCQDWEMI